MQLDGKSAIVTGGGTGVGRETALMLAKKGCQVAINYSRSKSEAEATGRDIEAAGGRALVLQADVADDAACRGFVAEALARFGRLDILVNNAGTTRFIPHRNLDAVTAEAWQQILAVNLIGPFQLARAAQESLTAAHGQIVNVASTAGVNATGSSIPYCASKAALINMTMALARVMAPNVRVNAIAPGFITGRWLEQGLGPAYDRTKTAVETRSALKRVCDPIDVARAILSLLEGSELITGQTLVCDGGMTLGALEG
jgi:NAD(P)-dependent dehydrogenase (short-subunit alcohol dehydrogenase family)